MWDKNYELVRKMCTLEILQLIIWLLDRVYENFENSLIDVPPTSGTDVHKVYLNVGNMNIVFHVLGKNILRMNSAPKSPL